MRTIINAVNKNLFISAYVLIFSLYSCASDNMQQYKSEGSIIGQDLALCACCGGWKIVISGTTYLFDKLPSNSTIILDNEKFPLKVKLDWEINSTNCKRIVISRIVKI